MAGNGRKRPDYNYVAAMYAMDAMVRELRRCSRWLERLLADEDAVADLSDWERFGASFPEDLEELADDLRGLLQHLGAWRSPGGEWGGEEAQHDGSRSVGSVPRGPGHAERGGVGVASR